MITYTVPRESPPCILASLAVLFGLCGAGCEIYTSREKQGGGGRLRVRDGRGS